MDRILEGSRPMSVLLAHRLRQGATGVSRQRQAMIIRGYRLEIEQEMKAICIDVLDLISNHLLPSLVRDFATTEEEMSYRFESNVYYLQMQGDFHRYLAEAIPEYNEERAGHIAVSRIVYYEGDDTSRCHLRPRNPMKLKMARKLSSFLHDVDGNREAAYQMASQAVEEANYALQWHPPSNAIQVQESCALLRLLVAKRNQWAPH